jgi:hypothetical protein
MITVFSYHSLFLENQELVLLIIYILLVVYEGCIQSLVDYEFLRYQAFVRTMCQAQSNKNRILPGWSRLYLCRHLMKSIRL